MNEKKDQVELFGYVEEIIYRNEDNGYCVCMVDCQGEPVTMVGTIPCLYEGEGITGIGEWGSHPVFGEQFRIWTYERTSPKEAGAILHFLQSGALPGVGPATAQKLVERFGKDTLDVMINDPQLLTQIKGMTLKKARQLQGMLTEQRAMQRTMEFCANAGIPSYIAVSLYQEWEDRAIDMLTENPYRLCGHAIAMEFEQVQAIAQTIGGTDCSKQYRIYEIEAAVFHVLRHNQRSGHTFLPYDFVVSSVSDMLQLSGEESFGVVEKMCENGDLIHTQVEGTDALYLPYLFEAELYIATKLSQLCGNTMACALTEEMFGHLEEEFSIKYEELQKEAIRGAMSKGVFVLTGGPGTGKTTIIRAIIQLCRQMGEKVLLAAPTGRAAKRMGELCGDEAKTIHRLLKMEYSRGPFPRFAKNEKSPLKGDVIIVDECSMVDTLLFESLLRAIRPGSRLILVGDANQLPSIGAGNVLREIIESECMDSVELTEIYRQAKESLIVVNAHLINRGDYPDLEVKTSDFFFLHCPKEEEVEKLLVSLCRDRLPRAYPHLSPSCIQVIAPTKKGVAGTINLNRVLQETLNPPHPQKPQLIFRDTIFRLGDKVMQMRNNYTIEWSKEDDVGCGMFNGDVGEIIQVNPQSQTLVVAFDDRRVEYAQSMLSELDLAYAITIHKSQGSEFPVVLLPLLGGGRNFLTRSLLYTAVTRAQEMVIVVGKMETVYNMVNNNRQSSRFCGLKALIRQEIMEGA
jgi:exodeoxyribonuclease V alpha subunit